MMENEMRPFRLSDCDVENTSHEQIAANKRAATLSSWTVGDGIHQIHGSASFNTPTSSTTTQHYDEEEMRGSPFSLCGWPLRKRHFQGVCSQFNFGASQSGGEKQKCGGRERKERLELHDDDNVRKIKMNFVLLFLVVSFSLCDLIVMEHTALPWKMPFQLSLADETTNSRHNESRFFGRALFNNHRKNK
jgi:hypothetical protein